MGDIDVVVKAAIESRVFPGCVVGILKRGKRDVRAFGSRAYADALVTRDTVYDCASLTKSVVTATLAHQLVDEGKIALDELVAMYLPAFRNAQSESTTIRHLLTYAVGGYALAPLAHLSAQEIEQYVLTTDFDAHPGIHYRYANMPAFLLGLVIESVTNKSLNDCARERIFIPHSMRHSSLMKASGENVVPTEVGVCGIVHDESARVFARGGRAVGHAGLFSTADDLLNFCEIVMGKNIKDRPLYFSSAVERRSVFTDGIGWEQHAEWMGEYHSLQAIGKTGFTGTSVLIDHVQQTVVVILSNRTFPKRSENSAQVNEVRRTIANLVLT